MKVKVRFLADKLDATKTLLDTKHLQLGTTVYTKKFPLNKDIGVLTIIEGMTEDRNEFQICVKNSQEEVLGRGEVFRGRLLTKKNSEGIIIYNVNNAYFENKMDFYIIELWNGAECIDKFELNASVDIYDVYENLDEKGMISLV